jgi:sugar/nucleoside kinase (ribokinase family)
MLTVEYLESRAPKNAVIWGDAPKDKIPGGFKPGGPGYYIAGVFEKLNIEVTLVSYIGRDYPKEMLPKVRLIPETPVGDKSMMYDNIYTPDGRIQFAYLNDCAQFPTYPDIMQSGLGLLVFNQDLLFITPLRRIEPDVVRDICRNFLDSMTIGLIQGWGRDIASDGKVSKRNVDEVDRDIEKIKNEFNLLVYSDEDMVDAVEWGRKWSNGENAPLVIVTQNIKGCTVIINGKEFPIDAYQIDQIKDPTGAGDRFAAFFAFMYKITDDWKVSARFANAAAAYALQRGNGEIELNRILEFAEDNGYPIF